MFLLQTPNEMAAAAARRFKEIRRVRRVTIKALSRDSGVPYSTIRRFESTGEISFVSLAKLASTMGLDDQINALFADIPPRSIEEVIRANRR